MPRVSLGFPVLITVAITGGIAARLFWNATANHQEPPIWVPILVGFLVITVGLAFKVQVDRRVRRGRDR
ncbi:hypothetical protein [Streptomyces rubiginosohelvolus]|uniref:Integral membrane protein n=1 Tax=Streptomyces rubiginosohelvolus TaxID=67362 RepID=A0ABQ3CBL7_9ACTN|nr:hypothetical protein [Streptomyces pluricolorescens]GGZ83159.1 hypothetical protein GCM10010328_66910 [Streptomyces pluricolorescens]